MAPQGYHVMPHPPPPPMHHIHQNHGLPVVNRPPLATVSSNAQPFEQHNLHWKKPLPPPGPPATHVPAVVQQPQPPMPMQQAVHAPRGEVSTPSFVKPQSAAPAKLQVKTPITLCFERFLGAGKKNLGKYGRISTNANTSSFSLQLRCLRRKMVRIVIPKRVLLRRRASSLTSGTFRLFTKDCRLLPRRNLRDV